MSISNELNNSSNSTLVKLENALDRLKEYDNTDGSINEKLGSALSLFKTYFNTLEDPEFKPVHLKNGDVASSEDYNANLKAIYNDLSRYYQELDNFNEANIKAYNYSQVVIEEIRRKAAQLSSIVLDLRILNNFTRGDVIVAGDDFLNEDLIDRNSALGSDKAEIIPGGAGLSLARVGTNTLLNDPRVEVDILPLTPAQSTSSTSSTSSVNTSPTPGNLERFYEGSYYSFLGEARPEGGTFNLQSIINVDTVSGEVSGEFGSTRDTTIDETIVLEYGASEEAKKIARLKMLDSNPDTFWECEYLQRLEDPLQDDIQDLIVSTEEQEDSVGPTTASVDVNIETLNEQAAQEDNLDLTVDIVITLPFEQNVNFVSINPLLFSSKAYIEVLDISTTNDTQVDFETVPNWAELQFPKTITPEANEFLTDSQEGASLAPSKFAYGGQGIYPFPVTVANKIKLRVRMANPIAQIYERTYVLVKNTVDVRTTITTKVTKGLFRF